MSSGWPQHPMRVSSLGQQYRKELTDWQYAYGDPAGTRWIGTLGNCDNHRTMCAPGRAGALDLGQTFQWEDEVLTVAEPGRRYWQGDLMSLGRAYGEDDAAWLDNGGWRQDAVCRPATATTATQLEARG